MVVNRSLAQFYDGKSVLVTGHTGFKGGWLTTWLKGMGSQVAGIALPPKAGQPTLFESARVSHGMKSVFGDIRDLNLLVKIFKQHSPEIVFHNAAQALVRRSYDDPVETYSTNVMGTVHVLEAARQTSSVRAVIVVTSDKCYENQEWDWGYRERDPMGGYDPYSSSKGCAELVTAAYRRSFFNGNSRLLVASARAGNVIGGGDWAEDRIIPDLVRGIARKAPVVIRNPHAIRPWQHVLEPLRGYLMLAQKLGAGESEFAEAWNFGPASDQSISVEDLTNKFVRLWGEVKIKVDRRSANLHEAHFLRLDSGKASSRLGWRTLLSTEDALQLTVEWYRRAAAGKANAEQITGEQIRDYMDRAC